MLRPIVLTTDCGAEIDDQFALAHQALSPVIDLRAVITTHIGEHKTLGDSASAFTAASAQDVLSNLPLATVPDVVAGAPLPLAAKGQPRSGAGADRILAEASGFSADARLSVLAIGAVTDVASALLLDSTLAERIEVLAMGYDAWPDGGDPFNVKNDIFAWQALLDSSVPLTVGDSAVCKAHLVLTPESAGTRFPETAAAAYIEGLFKAWVEAHPKICRFVTGDERGWPIWDQVTTAYLLGMTDAVEHPRPRLADDISFVHDGAGRTPLTWITRVDEERLWADLAILLAA